MKKWTTWALESAKVTHWHDATADNDCSGDTPACLISRLNTIKMWNLQEFWKLSRQPWWLCHADVFHLCLLCSPTFWTLHLWSRLSARRPPLSPLLFTLSIDTPTPPLPLSLCFTGGGWLSLPPGLAITRNLLSIAPFDFSQMCHVPTSISFTFHCQTLKLLFVLPFISPLVSLWLMNTCYKVDPVDPVVFFFLILDILVWRLIITIGRPHSSPSLPSSQRTWSHFSYQHCLNTWTFFFLFYTKFIHKIQKHYMIVTGQHYVARRKYVVSLKMWLCGLLELHQITGIIVLSFLTLAVCYPPTLDFHVRVCI